MLLPFCYTLSSNGSITFSSCSSVTHYTIYVGFYCYNLEEKIDCPLLCLLRMRVHVCAFCMNCLQDTIRSSSFVFYFQFLCVFRHFIEFNSHHRCIFIYLFTFFNVKTCALRISSDILSFSRSFFLHTIYNSKDSGHSVLLLTCR